MGLERYGVCTEKETLPLCRVVFIDHPTDWVVPDAGRTAEGNETPPDRGRCYPRMYDRGP